MTYEQGQVCTVVVSLAQVALYNAVASGVCTRQSPSVGHNPGPVRCK